LPKIAIDQGEDVGEAGLLRVADDGLDTFVTAPDEVRDERAVPDGVQVGAGELVLDPKVDRSAVEAGPRDASCHGLQTPDSTPSRWGHSQERGSSSGTR